MNTFCVFPYETGPLCGPTAASCRRKGRQCSALHQVLGMDSLTVITRFSCLWPRSALVRLAGSLQLSAQRGHCSQHSWLGQSSCVYIAARPGAAPAHGRQSLSGFDYQTFPHSSSPVSSLLTPRLLHPRRPLRSFPKAELEK